ncbi:unnamed protein product [Eruca vesicaria subsp. sativa]|uniref:Phytocyanin domain-containing protein n=1 Tax=Eruca vesicaria subsp. sativa TaxID=29727 RepID=A0ABC8LH60_ERUVS|nr:unnamed protein product [Eruca vesicaria subsp. sativa]
MARSSAHVSYAAPTVPMAIIMTVLCLFLANNVTHARTPATYIVGDEYGWDAIILMDTWAKGKTFYAGDILEFKYDLYSSNVMVVNRTGYETCIPNENAEEHRTGDDRIQLPYGLSYYIGTADAADCSAGLKMAIKAN